MATRTAGAGSTTWTAAAFSGGAATTAADEVVVPTGATLTISAANTVVCRNISVTGTGTLIYAATTSIANIGDATAGTGNVALSVAGTATITLTGIGQMNFISTSATQQTIDSGGKTLPTVTLNGAGSSYLLSSALTTSGVLTISRGAFDTSGSNHAISCSAFNYGNNLARTLVLRSSVITVSSAAGFTGTATTNLTVSSNSATLTTNASSANLTFGSINWGGLSLIVTGGNVHNMNVSGAILANYSYTGTAVKTNTITLTGDLTVTGTFTVNGNSAINRPLIASNTRGTARTITAATVTITNADFMDIMGAGAGNWNLSAITGNSGDAGGNSGITFTAPATQTATGTASFLWSTHGWTSRVPLPQDNVVVNNAFIAGRTVTMDMPRLGANIDYSGLSGNPALAFNTTTDIYGNLTMPTTTTTSGTQVITFSGRGSHTITSNGFVFTNQITFNGFGGTYTLQDTFNTSNVLIVTTGTLNTNNQTVTCLTFLSASATTRAITFGTSTINVTQTTAVTVFSLANTGSLTLSAGSSTIVIATASANTRILSGANAVLGNLTYTVAGSTGALSITGSNWFNNINFSDVTNARTLTFAASSSTILLGNFNVVGTSGKLMTVNSSTGGTFANITRPIGGTISTDYIAVQDIKVLQPYMFFAGANSTNTSNNLNISFTAPPAAPLSRQSTGAANGTSASHTATFPISTVAGNLLIYAAVFQQDPGTFTPPDGFALAKDNIQGTAVYAKIYYKVADGTETSITASWVTTRANDIAIYEVSGFTGTPTLDVTDSNQNAGTQTSLSTGAGVTNTVAPAFFIATVGGQGTLGASAFGTPPTNSFQEDYAISGGRQRVAVLPVTSTASQSTTITWTTARVPVSALAVFKSTQLPQSPSAFLAFFDGF